MTVVARAHQKFSQWLGKEYDLDALDAVLAAAAVQRLDGDPVWLLVVSGSGNAKTETVASLAGAGAHVTSTITSEGALLSAVSTKDRTKDAHGGLLRKIGDDGLLVIKDFTSILSMSRDPRAAVIAALREAYDGRWERNVGTDGGRTLTWTGRIVLIGAVTSAYDAAWQVIAKMGDRFALIRMDSTTGRTSAGRQALANVGHESQMREELVTAARDAMLGLSRARAVITDDDMERLLEAADIVTLSRTAVERDYRGDPIEAHAPEMPTRFAKMLAQILRGGLALGMTRAHARRIALRVARDSMSPMRALVLADVTQNPGTPCRDVVRRIQRPRSTVDRTLQELHLIGLLSVSGSEMDSAWRYHLAADVDEAAMRRLLLDDLASQECQELDAPFSYPDTPCSDISGEQDPPEPRASRRVQVVKGAVPRGSVYVGSASPTYGLRASQFANPHRIGRQCTHCRNQTHSPAEALRAFQLWTLPGMAAQARMELRGHDLACTCAPDEPCHADLLLEVIA